MTFTLDDLALIIKARRASDSEKSYTKSLFEGGPALIAKKFGEEAVETVIAALQSDKTALTKEAADTLYHLLVLLEARGVSLADVLSELHRRTAQSGHAEKSSRGASS
jgi:phosphoribosyl-ATP pyrophosphohydrolase